MERLALALFLLCLPLFLFTSSLRLGVNSLALYEYGFDKYEVNQSLGVSREELSQIGRKLISYFNSAEENLQLQVGGEDFFNEREVIHLRDVKGLIRLGYRVHWGTLACFLGFILYGLRRHRLLARGLVWGSGFTLLLVLTLGLAFLFAFDPLFYYFHLISFPNLFWQLNPATDRLIVMFPQGFFYQTAMFMVGAIVLGAIILGVAGWLIGRSRS